MTAPEPADVVDTVSDREWGDLATLVHEIRPGSGFPPGWPITDDELRELHRRRPEDARDAADRQWRELLRERDAWLEATREHDRRRGAESRRLEVRLARAIDGHLAAGTSRSARAVARAELALERAAGG